MLCDIQTMKLSNELLRRYPIVKLHTSIVSPKERIICPSLHSQNSHKIICSTSCSQIAQNPSKNLKLANFIACFVRDLVGQSIMFYHTSPQQMPNKATIIIIPFHREINVVAGCLFVPHSCYISELES